MPSISRYASTGPLPSPDQVGFVGLEAVQREPVLLGVDGDGAQAEFVGGPEDADRDFAAVECEELLQTFSITDTFFTV